MSWYKKAFLYYKLQLHKFADYEDEWQSQVESLAANNPYPFKHLFVNGGNRIYLPFSIDGNDDESADRNVKALLEENGYKITDYRGGYCSDGRNTFKIGKILNKLWKNDLQELQRKFENDEIYNLEREIESSNQYYQNIINAFQNSSYRVGKQVSGFSVVISQDPHDVAKMSTDRDWTSCMELGTGQHYHDVFCEVQEGGLVAYLINSNDTEITKPLARIRIRRFASDDGRNILAPEEAIYGNEVKGFQQFVKDWVKSVQGDISEGLYYLKGGEWSDTFSQSMFVMPNNEEDVLRCWRGEVDTSSYVRYKVTDELEGEDEYGNTSIGFPKYFSTKEEAQQFINSIDPYDEWREVHGDYWLEKDEDGEWSYDRYKIREDITMTKDAIKGQAALLITNAPKGEYATELINEIKEWALKNSKLSSIKRTVVNALFDKYPEVFSYEEAQMEGTIREYKFVKEMPDGPEKDMIKQNILNDIKTRLSDITKLFTANDRVMTIDLRLEVNFSEYIDSPLKELFSPIPGDVTKLLINMANKLKNDEPLGLDKLPDEQLDPMYRGDKKIEESMLTHDARLSLCSKIIRLFDSTNTDVPEVQAFYESLLPEWGYNRKQQKFEHAFPPYSTINVESLGYAIGKLGENGTKFLPFLKERLKEEQVLLEKVKSDYIEHQLYGKSVTKNVEKYLYIINAIENKSGFSQKYKFFSTLNWYKTAQNNKIK